MNTISIFLLKILIVSWFCIIDLTSGAQPPVEWSQTYGGSGNEVANAIQQTFDGGFIIAGYTDSRDGDVKTNKGRKDFWILKIDNQGQVLWDKVYGGSKNEEAKDTLRTTDSGYIVTGWTNSSDGDVSGNYSSWKDVWIVKLDKYGNLAWTRSYGGSLQDIAYQVIPVPGGAYLAGGSSASENGNVTKHYGSIWIEDYWLVKMDSVNGALIWEKNLGGTDVDILYDLALTFGGNYLLVGASQSVDKDVTGHHGPKNTFDIWVVKIDTSGNILWEKSLGGDGNDEALKIITAREGKILVAGNTTSKKGFVPSNKGKKDFLVGKVDQRGKRLWFGNYGGSKLDSLRSFQETRDGGLILAGTTESGDGDIDDNRGGKDIWVVKLPPYHVSITEGPGTLSPAIYPTPAVDQIIIKISQTYIGGKYSIVNIYGRTLQEQEIHKLKTKISLDTLPRGVYFVMLTNRNGGHRYCKFIRTINKK